MYNIKISISEDASQFLRQTPNCAGIWRKYKFIVNNDQLEKADFWVVLSKGRRKDESCIVPRENTIFISGEPDSVYKYADKFLEQFSTVVAPSCSIHHKNKIIMQPGLLWFSGVHFMANGHKEIDIDKNYDFYKENFLPKYKLISMISSNLAITKGHQKRLAFVNAIKNHYGEKIDFFGHGFNNIDDKYDALAPYKYHIVIENSSYPHYWTEKLSDCILAGAYPIYFGCPNICEYLPEHSFVAIDINNPEEAIHIIDNVISEDFATKYSDQLLQAKELILNKYNVCNLIADICDKLNPNIVKNNIWIKNELSYFNFNKLKMILSRVYYRVLFKIKFN